MASNLTMERLLNGLYSTVIRLWPAGGYIVHMPFGYYPHLEKVSEYTYYFKDYDDAVEFLHECISNIDPCEYNNNLVQEIMAGKGS